MSDKVLNARTAREAIEFLQKLTQPTVDYDVKIKSTTQLEVKISEQFYIINILN